MEAVVDALLARAALERADGDVVVGAAAAVRAVDGAAVAAVAPVARAAVGGRAEVRGRELVRARDGVALLEGLEVEDALEEGPGERQVGGDERRRGLADVPEGPIEAEGGREAVVLVEDGGDDLERGVMSASRRQRGGLAGGETYGEGADGEDAAEDHLALHRQRRLEEDGHGDEDDHDVGGDVEDGVGDEVVRRGRALGCGVSVSIQGVSSSSKVYILLSGGTAQYCENGLHQTPKSVNQLAENAA